MTPKGILVPFVGSDHDILGRDVACKLAHQFQTHVDALYVRPNPAELSLHLGIDDGSHEDLQAHHRQRVDEESRRAAARARRQFNAACKKRDLPRVRKAARADTASAHFVVRLGETAEQIPDEAKLADLIVFAGHWAHHHQVLPSLLENVLLECGMPALCWIEEGGAAFRDPHEVVDYLGWRGLEAEARIG